MRDRHGAEMEEMFADAWRAARARGGWATAGLAARTVKDLTLNGLGARMERGMGMDAWTAELGQTLRSLARRPGFLAVAVATLALGIGGNTAIYSIVDAAWLDALPYPDDDRLVVPYNAPAPDRGRGFAAFSAPFYTALRDERVFASVTDVVPDAVTVGGDDRPERVAGARVSPSFFDVVGVPPALGRPFLPGEAGPGGPDVAVLGHGLWTRRFAADPSVVGRTVIVDGRPTTVVGVMPPGFSFLFDDVEAWTPTRTDEAAFTRTTALNNNRVVAARLAPGTSRAGAAERLPGAVERLRRRFPDAVTDDHAVVLVPLRTHLYGGARDGLVVLLGAVGLVLLIACANLANLLLVRGEARRSELAVRAALGAGRGRLVRGLLIESLLIAALGGAAGLLFAGGVLELVRPLAPSNVPLPAGPLLDGSVLAFTAVVAVGTGLLFGLLPAWSAARTDLRAALVGGGRGAPGGPRGARGGARGALVVAEVGLTVVLLVASGLLLNSLWRLQAVDPGFGLEDRLTAPVALDADRYPAAADLTRFYQRLLPELEASPAVSAAGLGLFVPLTNASNWGFEVEGREEEGVGFADYTVITPGYLEAMGQRVVRGRGVTWADAEPDARPVVLVSEAMARRLWPGQDPVGRRINVDTEERVWRDVVGVVSDVRNRSLAQEPGDLLYFPPSDLPMASPRGLTLVVHHAGAGPPAAELRRTLASLDPAVPATQMRPLDAIARASEGRRVFMMALLGLFAAVALALAAVGLYGVVAYTVSLRTREIGLRMAVGAGRARVLRMVAGRSATLVGAGLLVGLAGSAVLGRLLEGLLFGVTATDPLTYLGVVVFLAGVAALASWVPAARATSVDPAVVLRE